MTEFVEVNTQDLVGTALEWSVAKSAGWVNARIVTHETPSKTCYEIRTPYGTRLQPSLDWSQGGPLISRCVTALNQSGTESWWAHAEGHLGTGETPLLAACRAIVASVLGDTVSVPKELLP